MPEGREALNRPSIRQAFREVVWPDVESNEPHHRRLVCSPRELRRVSDYWVVADELYPNRDPDVS